jgi:hypothetical protein
MVSLTRAVLVCLVAFGSKAAVTSFRDTQPAQGATKAWALPAVAADPTSTVMNVPSFMVSMDEGGSIPSEPAATCDDKPGGNSAGSAGLHLEHYFADAKVTFDQKVGLLRQYMTLKQGVQSDAGSAAVIVETLDGAEAAYFIAKGDCIQDAHPSATRVRYYARLIHDTTYADITIAMYAMTPDAARKYAREMLQKIGGLNYASVK